MKTLLLFIALCIGTIGNAQDCKGYYFMQKNGKIDMTVFNDKDKPMVVVHYKVTDVQNSGNSVTSSVQVESVDSDGKQIGSGAGKIICSGSNLSIDMGMSMTSMEQLKGMEVKSNDAYLDYPSNLSTGMQLKEGTFDFSIATSGDPFSQINMKYLNRKVEGKESITTPAGTWDCFKITYDSEMKMKMALGISIPVKIKAVEYFAPGFGVVKTVTYNKKGKLSGTTMITAYSK